MAQVEMNIKIQFWPWDVFAVCVIGFSDYT